MLARTKTHHIEEVDKVNSTSSKKKNWRNIFKKELTVHGEQGLYLRGLRLRENYTQAELGQLIGISPSNISAMEHGRRLIGKEVAQRLAKVFRTDYRMFL
jgi:DNA-binding XRE family transcriptional regulator